MEYKSLEEWALKEMGRPEGNLDEFVLGRIAERDKKIEVLEEERKRLDEKVQYFKGALSALEKENERLNQKVEELENTPTPTIAAAVEEPEALGQPEKPQLNSDEEKVKRFIEALMGGDKDGDRPEPPKPEESEEENQRRKIANGFGNFLNAIDEMVNKIDEETKARRERFTHKDNLALVDGFVMDTIMRGAPAIKAMLDKWVPQYNYRGEIALMNKIYEALLAVICLDTEDVYAAIADTLREPEGYNGDLGQGQEAEQNGNGNNGESGNNGNDGPGPDDYNDFWSGGFGNA